MVLNSLEANSTQITILYDIEALSFTVEDDGNGMDKKTMSLIGNIRNSTKPKRFD